jgi:hypothetical protein
MRRLRLWFAAAALAVFAPVVALAGISPGSKMVGTIDRTINSKSAQVGTPFILSNAHTTNYDINGATVYGHVSEVERAGQGRKAKISLAVDKVNTRSGNIYQIHGYTSNVQVNTKSNAGKEVGGAAGGALIGGLIGHTAGAIIGGAGGFLLAKNSRENVTIPEGSIVTVQITQARRQAAHP